jgi:hypothetical protein
MGDSTNAQRSGKDGKHQPSKNGFKGKCQGKGPNAAQSLNSDLAVPMLHVGVSKHYDLFKRRVSIACMEKYKNLGRLIMD